MARRGQRSSHSPKIGQLSEHLLMPFVPAVSHGVDEGWSVLLNLSKVWI